MCYKIFVARSKLGSESRQSRNMDLDLVINVRLSFKLLVRCASTNEIQLSYQSSAGQVAARVGSPEARSKVHVDWQLGQLLRINQRVAKE